MNVNNIQSLVSICFNGTQRMAKALYQMNLSVFGKVMAAFLIFSLAFASVHSKAMGLAWVAIVLTALGLGFFYFNQTRNQATSMWACAWLKVACVVLLLKTIPMLYWADPWSARHGELRLILGALGTYVIARSGLFSGIGFRLQIGYVLTWSSVIGLIWVIVYGRGGVPSHPIPWAASMAMVSALLLAMALKSDAGLRHRRIWFSGGVCAVLAVLTSQSRGAFGIVVWWLLVCGVHFYRQFSTQTDFQTAAPRKILRHFSIFLLALVSFFWAISYTPIAQRPLLSIHAGIDEFLISKESPIKGANSSVGARIFMWGKAIQAIQESPWIGHGQTGRKQLISDWAEEADSPEIQGLSHVHNEFLNQWIDHGLWGLASQLWLLIGLMWICRKLYTAQEHTAAFGLGGMAFVHLTASLSNVNFGHDYYTACFSTLVGLCILMIKAKDFWHAHALPAPPTTAPVNPTKLWP
jgi:O-antigen ligase